MRVIQRPSTRMTAIITTASSMQFIDNYFAIVSLILMTMWCVALGNFNHQETTAACPGVFEIAITCLFLSFPLYITVYIATNILQDDPSTYTRWNYRIAILLLIVIISSRGTALVFATITPACTTAMLAPRDSYGFGNGRALFVIEWAYFAMNLMQCFVFARSTVPSLFSWRRAVPGGHHEEVATAVVGE